MYERAPGLQRAMLDDEPKAQCADGYDDKAEREQCAYFKLAGACQRKRKAGGWREGTGGAGDACAERWASGRL